MAVFGFGTYALLAWQGGNASIAGASVALCAAASDFLLFNFPPAKVFMGDAGSIPLGFLAAAIGLLGWQETLWPLWVPLVAFGPFVLDATVTLGKRVLRREKIWHAHRTHYYQRLIQSGWGHRRTALAAYCLMAFSAMVAATLLVHVAVGAMVDRAWVVHQRRVPAN